MVKLFSVMEMISLEKEANATGLSYKKMMENAGKGIAEIINDAYSHLQNKKIFALTGSGNNGGDALVALFYLAEYGWETCAYVVRKRESDDPLIKRLIKNKGDVIDGENDKTYSQLAQLLESNTVLLDGVFGTGIKLPLNGEVAEVLSFIKTRLEISPRRLHVVAVDCPSGVDCDSGEVAAETIPADITVTMVGMKIGLVKFPAAEKCGIIHITGIGPIESLPSFVNNNKIVLDDEIIKKYLPRRPLDAHKGTFGTVYIIAGSVNFTGAALLAGMAAYRIGAGLVTMAIPAPLHSALAGQFPESTWVLLPDEMGVISVEAEQVVKQTMDRATALLIGPGFGLEETTKEFINRLFNQKSDHKRGKIGFITGGKVGYEESVIRLPVVLDADGLKLTAKIDNWSKILPSPAVLTPHPGEMAILTGLPIEEIQQNRIDVARRFSASWGHVVVLKGAYTVIAEPEGQIAIVPVATPALAKAGTGDVLAGLIAGLLAQGVPAFQAACVGAWIHAIAGVSAADFLGNTVSVVAGDVLRAVPRVISNLVDQEINQNNGTRYSYTGLRYFTN